MKKILLFAMICGLVFTGCAMRVSTSIKTVAIPEDVRPLPLTADLKISEQKVRGEATARMSSKLGGEERIIREAVARALGQDPPKADAPDVLVAMNVYKELNGKDLTVVVTGYPAWYRNFRTVEPDDSALLILVNVGRWGQPAGTGKSSVEGTDGGFPFAAPEHLSLGVPLRPTGVGAVGRRYYLGANATLLGSRTMTGEWVSFEGGLRGRNGLSYGLEVGGGFLGKSDSDQGKRRSAGGGFNIDRTYDLPSDGGHLVYGMSLGYWYGEYYKYQYNYEPLYKFDYVKEIQYDNLYGGPYIKYRWKVIQISYRGLVGMRKGHDEGSKTDKDPVFPTPYYTSNDGLALVSQFKVGLHFKL